MSAATIAAMLGALAVSICAQDRPGIDRPIRVGSFIGVGSGGFRVESAWSGSTALEIMLKNPDTAGLGPGLVIPPKGFSFTRFGDVCDTCIFSYTPPTAAQTEAFISALDTLDVAYIGCFSALDNVISNSLHREKLRTFMLSKSYVGVNRVTDSRGSWPALDSIHGVRFASHRRGDRNATLRRDSVADNDADWKYLNQGLLGNGLDTAFRELWFFWATNGGEIREGNSLGSMLITVKLLEESFSSGVAGASAIEDHPMSWGRRMAAGGRVFYTGLGHRSENYIGGPENPRFLRRQIYNAILWTAKYDSLSQAAAGLSGSGVQADASAAYGVEALSSALRVTWLRDGNPVVDLLGIDGRRVARREGNRFTGKVFIFENLSPGVYALAVDSPQGRITRLVAVP